MFGKLTLDAIPTDPIVLAANGLIIVVALLVVGLITYYRQWRYLYTEWLCSVDHKKIGIMYMMVAFVFLLRGFTEALMMRAQQATAGPGMEGYLGAEHFAELFSGHGTMMIIFVAMPFVIGLMNIVVPLQLGTRDVAYPFLNSLSFWLTAAGAALMMLSLMVGQFSTAGWTGYPPFSTLPYNPSSGVDYWIWAIQISGVGTTLTGINFLVTILRQRAPGMTLLRMPMFLWTALTTNILMILAFPALTVTLALLTLDRTIGTHFFTTDMGGDQMMYINMFWIWGHPEVYIVILPAFGVFSEVVTTYSNKRLFGYFAMVCATVAIALLSFTVWAHHFFTMGQGPMRNAIFGIASMLIGVPTGVKIYDWMWTMYRGRIEYKLPMLWTVGFIITFVMGGMSGVLLAIPGADYKMHNTLYLVAHFHNVLIGGTLFGMFAGYYYWFPKVFGFRLNEKWGQHSFWGWLIGFFVAFVPLYWLGVMGMPRRMYSYDNPAWTPWLIIAAIGALIVLYGVICMVIQLLVSIRDREHLRDVTGDCWGGRTLEWSTSSPPPEYNFAVIPTVSDRDAFMEMKINGEAYKRPSEYQDIHMPKTTPAGLILAGLALLFGFGFIWHIWWLVLVSSIAMAATVIVRASNDDTEYTIPAAEVERIENERHRQLEQAGVFDRPPVTRDSGDLRLTLTDRPRLATHPD